MIDLKSNARPKNRPSWKPKTLLRVYYDEANQRVWILCHWSTASSRSSIRSWSDAVSAWLARVLDKSGNGKAVEYADARIQPSPP